MVTCPFGGCVVDYRVEPCSSRYEGPVGAVFGDDSRSVMTLIDEFSQTMRAYFLQDDGEAISCFVAGKTKVEKQTGERVTRLRGNNGMERGYGAFVCNTISIVFHRTDALKSPQRGCTAERIVGVLCGLQSTVSHGDLGHVEWAGALDTAGFMASGSPSRAIGCRTPIEMWSGSLVDFSHRMRVSGCSTWVRVRDGQHKLGTGPCVCHEYASGTIGCGAVMECFQRLG